MELVEEDPGHLQKMVLGQRGELGVENPQFWWHLRNCPDLHGVHTTLVSHSSYSKQGCMTKL